MVSTVRFTAFVSRSIYIYSGILFLERKVVKPSFTHTSSFLMPGIQIQEVEISENSSETELPDNIDSSFVRPSSPMTLTLILYTGKRPTRLDHLRRHSQSLLRKNLQASFKTRKPLAQIAER